MDAPTVTPITLREALELHSADLSGLQDLAKGTVRNYAAVYNTLRRHLTDVLGREPLTTDITVKSIEGYFRDYVAVECPTNYGSKRSALRLIVRWLMRNRHMELGLNPAEELPPRRVTKSSKRNRRLTDAQFLTLLKHAKRSCDRDYYLCLFMRLTGRRIGELVGDGDGQQPLVWGDILWEEGVIEWNNYKGRKLNRLMPLTPRIRAMLEAWRASYCKSLGVDEVRASWKLFPAMTPTGPARKGHSRRRIIAPNHRISNPDKVFRPLLEAAGLYEQRGDNSHLLRKSFANQRKQIATNQNRGDAWELTKIALDHEDVQTTRGYVDGNEDYDRYAQWAHDTPELSDDAMAAIPELASLAQTAQKMPAAAGDARSVPEVYPPSGLIASVTDLSSRRRLRAVQ